MSRERSSLAANALLVAVGLGCVERPRPPAESVSDGRQLTRVPIEARDAVRTEMRAMLASIHDILQASLVGDTAAMREAAVRSGLATAADPALEKLLPEGFLRLGMTTHQQFDDLARAVASGAPRDTIVGRLARLTGNCVSCHAGYRLELR